MAQACWKTYSGNTTEDGKMEIPLSLNAEWGHLFCLGLQAGVRLPTEQDPVDIKGFNQAPKAALHMRNAAGEAKTTYIPLISGPTVFVERAALVNHLRSETQRLHEDR